MNEPQRNWTLTKLVTIYTIFAILGAILGAILYPILLTDEHSENLPAPYLFPLWGAVTMMVFGTMVGINEEVKAASEAGNKQAKIALWTGRLLGNLGSSLLRLAGGVLAGIVVTFLCANLIIWLISPETSDRIIACWLISAIVGFYSFGAALKGL